MPRERRHPPKKRRRGRFRVLYQLLSLAVVAAAVVTACIVFFRANQIEVEGNSHYSTQEIIAASGISMGDNLVTMKGAEINKLVTERLPYVEQVELHRTLPDRVALRVTERTAAARVEGEGGWWLLSSNGYLLEPSDQEVGVSLVGLRALKPQEGRPLEVSGENRIKADAVVQVMEALQKKGLLSKCSKIDCQADSFLLVAYDIHQLKIPLRGDFTGMVELLQAALASDKVPEGEPRIFDFTVKDHELYVQRPKTME